MNSLGQYDGDYQGNDEIREKWAMEEKNQLAILKQGVSVWNKWRSRNYRIKINLAGEDLKNLDLNSFNLCKADLSCTDFRETKLCWANLEAANLFNVNFTYTDLQNANLCRANLHTAFLHGSNLMRANLKEANLIETELYDANLSNSNLDGAYLSGAIFGETFLANIDLSNTKGLDRVRHSNPSHISTNTLQRSKGIIDVKFLRGCGLSDWEIESAKLYQPGLDPNQITDISYKMAEILIGNPIQYYSIFISYSTKDQKFAQRLHEDLQNSGVRCWFAPEDIQGGKKIHEQIDAAVRTRDRLLLILSGNSMNSEWVKTEIANARQKEITEKRQVLFPIRLVDFEIIKEWKCFDADTGKDSAREIREYFIPDFSNWQDEKSYRPSFERLLKDLRATGNLKKVD